MNKDFYEMLNANGFVTNCNVNLKDEELHSVELCLDGRDNLYFNDGHFSNLETIAGVSITYDKFKKSYRMNIRCHDKYWNRADDWTEESNHVITLSSRYNSMLNVWEKLFVLRKQIPDLFSLESMKEVVKIQDEVARYTDDLEVIMDHGVSRHAEFKTESDDTICIYIWNHGRVGSIAIDIINDFGKRTVRHLFDKSFNTGAFLKRFEEGSTFGVKVLSLKELEKREEKIDMF